MLSTQLYWDKSESIVWLNDGSAATRRQMWANKFLASLLKDKMDSLYFASIQKLLGFMWLLVCNTNARTNSWKRLTTDASFLEKVWHNTFPQILQFFHAIQGSWWFCKVIGCNLGTWGSSSINLLRTVYLNLPTRFNFAFLHINYCSF
jgi:hypothetical protein